MVFLYPFLLFGLFAILIPVLIHLFNLRRYRKVYFTNVQLLQQLKRETKKQSQLKHLLVLFSRIMAIFFLVMAFAHPVIPLKNTIKDSKKNNLVSLYLDNSFSMQAQSADGELLSRAKYDAIEIANSFSNSDKYNLISNDFSANSNRTFSKDEIIDIIMNINYSPSVKTFSQIAEKQKNISSKNLSLNNLFFYISDFQKNTFDINNYVIDTNQNIFLLPKYAQNTNNIFIDSCYFKSPVIQSKQAIELSVVIKNSSEKDFEKLPMKLLVNGTQRGLSNFDIKANSETEVSIKFQVEDAGLKQCMLTITDYPVIYDDEFFFSFNVIKQYSILNIYNSKINKYLELLFSSDSLFSFNSQRTTSINYAELNLYNLILIDGISDYSSGLINALKNYLENGGNIVIFPPEEISADFSKKISQLININFNNADTVKTTISALNLNHILFHDIFEEIPDLLGNQKINLPYATKYYPIVIPQLSQTEEILSLQNGYPFLLESNINKGKLYVFASPLSDNWTNLQKHALIVPLMYRMVLTSQQKDNLFYTIAEDEIIKFTGKISDTKEFLVIKLNDEYEFIPEVINNDNTYWINVHNNINKAGNYTLMDEDNILSVLSYNFNRNESDLNTYSETQIKNLISSDSLNIHLLEDTSKTVSQTILELNEGSSLWKLFIILALVFLLLEIVIIRMWK